MIKEYEIKTTDGHIIYGALESATRQTERLIIHAHGMTHNMDGYLQLNSSPIFNQAGYDVFRFSFYDRRPGSRRLSESTLSSHCVDLRRVIEEFLPHYESVFLAAHSLSGLVFLILNPQNITGASLWDPSLDVWNFWQATKCLFPIEGSDFYRLDYGAEYVVGNAMVEEIKQYPHEICLGLAKQITTPVQVIIPEHSIFDASPHTSPRDLDSRFSVPYERVHLKNAGHRFTERGIDRLLFEKTLSWFDGIKP